MENKVFISYSWADRAHADAIAARLQALGVPYWLDHEELHPGEDIPKGIHEGIKKSFCLIILHSQNSYRSQYVRDELTIAQRHGVPVIPVQLDDQHYTQWWRLRVAHIFAILKPRELADQMDLLIEDVQRRFIRRAPVLTFTNFKGGVGKTTLAAHLSAIFADEYKKRVLLIDLDPQHNLSQFFFGSSTLDSLADLRQTAVALFEPGLVRTHEVASPQWGAFDFSVTTPVARERLVLQLVNTVRGEGALDLIPGQFDLAKYALLSDNSALNAARRNFEAGLHALRAHYDVIMLDTSPSISLLTETAIANADMMVSPLNPDRYGLRGLRLIRKALQERHGDHPGLKRATIVNRLMNPVNAHHAFFDDLKSGRLDRAIEAIAPHERRPPTDPESRHVVSTAVQQSNFMFVNVVGEAGMGVERLVPYLNTQVAQPIRESLYAVADDLKARLDNTYEPSDEDHPRDPAPEQDAVHA